MPPARTPEKADLRRQLRALRAAVPREERRRAARALPRMALRHRLLAAGKRIAFYMPVGSEIDIKPLILRARRMGVACYLPVLPARRQRRLRFAPLRGDMPRARRAGQRPRGHWRNNRFGIAEYQPGRRALLPARQLHALFMPLLGFDARGHRIGMGGGFYDATLAFLRGRRHWRAPRRIGAAYAAQAVARAPNDVWDIPLDAVLCEDGLRAAKRD